jgi:hypothetical protein
LRFLNYSTFVRFMQEDFCIASSFYIWYNKEKERTAPG